MVNLYKMGQDVIKAKKEFNARYDGLYEHQYCKLNKELWEEQIIEMEDEYVRTCLLYDNEPLEEVLNW
jgi:hypothetical protein